MHIVTLRFTVLLVWSYCLLSNLAAQQPRAFFQTYTTEDGLGAESINDVLTDRFGYVWTAAFSGLHRYDGYDFVHYPSDLLDSCTISNSIALKLLEDRNDHLWVATSSGLNRLDRATSCFHRYYHQPDDASSLPHNEVIDLALDNAGFVVVMTSNGPARYQPETDAFERLAVPEGYRQRLFSFRNRLFCAGPAGLLDLDEPTAVVSFGDPVPLSVNAAVPREDSLLIATNQGLYIWSPEGTAIRRYFKNPRHPVNRFSIRDLAPADLHSFSGYWLASRSYGMAFIDLSDGYLVAYDTEGRQPHSLLDNHVRTLDYDRQGNLWIGTYVGLNRLVFRSGQPTYYRRDASDGFSNQVLELHADRHGGVYAYERWEGLFRSDRLGLKAEDLEFPKNEFNVNKDLNHLFTDRQGITWLPRGNDALYRFNGLTKEPVPAIQHPDFRDRRLNAIHQDPTEDDHYWLATSKGLGRFHLEERRLEWWAPTEQEAALAGDVIATLLPTPDGRIWLCAGNYYNDRLGYFDIATERFYFYDYRAGDPERSAGGRIKQLAASPDGTVWAAASQGLIEVQPDTRAPQLITRVGDIRVGVLEALQTDEAGTVWFTSRDQVGHYLPTEKQLTMTTCSPIRQFGNAVSTKLPDGRLLFGGMGGIMSVDPAKNQDGGADFPRIVFNELRVDGRPRRTDAPLANLEKLILAAGERTLSLRFAGLFFDRTRDIEYAYRLNGNAWELLGADRSLSFTDLRPGDYLLELRASDGQANWSPEVRQLRITVPAFWHETGVARWGFWLLGLGLLFLLGRFLVQRRLERQNHEQLVALDAFKSRLFTDLTHEFRTPLTLILGPARRLRERAKASGDDTLGREARRIGQQGQRLLGLINQLLDLRKLEAGQLPVERVPTELNAFFAHLTESFHSGAETADLRLTYVGATAGAKLDNNVAPAAYLDRTKQETILTNLLGNALKFTPPGGEVTVRLTVDETEWSLSVADNGPGIPPDQQALIFERFQRAQNGEAGGTGIGLALVSELTSLLGGTITVESTPGRGSCFKVAFPLLPAVVEGEDDFPVMMPAVPAKPLPAPAITEPGDKPLVLIVEDSRAVADYLRESLETDYRVLVAEDGAIGLEKAFAQIPDLVVSDVMMPRLNGLQLTARLKADTRTSHLPVLLLTAKTAEEHRLEGLDRGADAYLSKPFNERELHLRLRNLLALRDRTAARLREEMLSAQPDPESIVAPPEAAWLTELRHYIHEQLDNPELKGADLERHLGMSRSQLHRKLSSVLGLSPARLINELRLETAGRMLREEEQTVSEVAYACGFRDPGYFGRKFKERFGVAPSAFPGPLDRST